MTFIAQGINGPWYCAHVPACADHLAHKLKNQRDRQKRYTRKHYERFFVRIPSDDRNRANYQPQAAW